MSHPHDISKTPDPIGQTKTLFCVHGNPQAVLVIDTAGELRSRKRKFQDAHAALDWCITNGANMAFTYARDHSRN